MAIAKKPSPKKQASSDVVPGTAERRATIDRKTSETEIRVSLDLDRQAKPSADTGVPFLDHMLDALGRHGFLGLEVRARGDIEIDDHHTVEDVGLALGQALNEALGDRVGIARFGHFEAPLDETLVAVTVDLSGRPYLVYNVKMSRYQVGKFDAGLIEDFMQAFATTSGLNLHINLRYGRNPHHIIEAMFKALAKALAQATAIDPRVLGVPSTKGTLTS